MYIIKLTIDGNPIPLQRHRKSKNGGYYDPSGNDKKDFILKCLQQHKKYSCEGIVSASLRFYVKRPKSHYRTGNYSNQLKTNAPIYCIKKPDLDNYIKFVKDALEGIYYKNDSQIAIIHESFKIYSDKPRTEITFYLHDN